MDKVQAALYVVALAITAKYGWEISSLLWRAGADTYAVMAGFWAACVAIDLITSLLRSLRAVWRRA
ncbi:hypothetical protein GOC60_14835 [Sinorhizobium meliloti]|nr:hypothetical protein [Sinorhizobium meliloti]